MTTKIDLPDGNYAILKDSDELTNREVKVLRRAARKVGIVGEKLRELGLNTDTPETEDDAEPDADVTAEKNRNALKVLTQISDDEDDDLDLFQRTCAAVRLVEWSLDLPLPKTPEDVDNLARPIYEALTTEAAKLELNQSFSKDEGLVDPTPDTTASSD